jgi:hypothetical protein
LDFAVAESAALEASGGVLVDQQPAMEAVAGVSSMLAGMGLETCINGGGKVEKWVGTMACHFCCLKPA